MRLLSKQEVIQSKALERKSEIDEGLKLARKVDLLRKTASEEESKLSKFRTESLKVVKSEIEELTKRRNVLREEVRELENIKLQLLINS